MKFTRQRVLRPFRIVRKKARIWRTETPQGRHIARLCARYKRRSKQFLFRTLVPNAGGVPQQAPVVSDARTQLCGEVQAAVATSLSSRPCESVQVLDTIKHYANPGPAFEKSSGMDSRELARRVRTVAFYLPQFHAFEDNDAWWGEGFSEWRNVARGAPRFDGHYQPRIPRDLGFYDLNSIDTIRAQSEKAMRHGIDAFCFYYYWFNGKRLMDMPLDKFAGDEKIRQDFCIMWANENWTRTWDGHDNEVLIQQDYLESDEADFIADTSRYMSNARYIRIDGRPLFILYRPGLLPQARETLQRWRDRWEALLGVKPWILMVQGFGDSDPRQYGLDGAVEFPPHKVAVNVPDMNHELTMFDPEFAGHVRSYEAVVSQSLDEPAPAFPLIKTVSPHWDNDARREGRGMVLHGSTPERYERWLNGAIDFARDNPFHDEPLVFINAWNEWAESAYLEPDVHYGHAYLNATQRAVHGLSALVSIKTELADASSMNRILLVGHDAHRHGAQMLLLSIATVLSAQFGMQVTVLLREGGPMLDDYKAVADTHVLTNIGAVGLPQFLTSGDFGAAICNTCVTGDLMPALKSAGLTLVSLIHEMPMLIEEFSLQERVRQIDTLADHVVFPSQIVQRGFTRFTKKRRGEQHIRPQGTYKQIVRDEQARRRIRRQLGLDDGDKMVLNVGYADLRKGFDLFLQTAQRCMKSDEGVHFVWAGAISADMQRWVQSDLAYTELAERIHLIGFTSQMSDYYSACDALFLSSREDPYPTVVLEAMNVGLPVILFREATGFDQVMQDYGFAIPRGDDQALETALHKALYDDTDEARTARIDYVESQCQLDDYCFELLTLARPGLEKVSVVVPNYNYEAYMPERLASIFEQDVPIFEVIVLDDCSSDESVKMIERCAKVAKRKIRLVSNETNSGNVFRQWQLGLSLCRGNRIWIAEADDLARASFLSRSLASFRKGTSLSFTDSAQVDEKGRLLADSYDYYYREVNANLFDNDFVLDGRQFVREALAVRNVILNVSAVLWDRQHLSSALSELGSQLMEYSLVGDWRLYLACLDSDERSIAFIHEPLNVHRRHSSSVTHSMDLRHHLDEILAMHACARNMLNVDGRQDSQSLVESQALYEDEIRRQFQLPAVARKAA